MKFLTFALLFAAPSAHAMRTQCACHFVNPAFDQRYMVYGQVIDGSWMKMPASPYFSSRERCEAWIEKQKLEGGACK